MARDTPLQEVGRGLAAGLAGTAAMTAAQTAVLKARGQEGSDTPAQVGRRIIGGVLKRDTPTDDATLNNAMHWGYGTAWGAVLGLARGTKHSTVLRTGLAFGGAVWAWARFVELPALKMAPPPWQDPPLELSLDVGFHLVYGLGSAAAYAALDR